MDDSLRKLEEQVEPRLKDIRFRQYVNYINAGLKHFVDERVYLVGSTGDGTKLTVPTDHGDADFLIVTGRMEVPVQSIEFRPESTSYCWIKTNDIPLEVDQEFEDNGYLKAFILQELHPQLFSIARGIYLHASSSIDRVGAANKDKTSLGIRSKVGLAHTTYKGIKIHGNLQRYRDIVTKTPKHVGIKKAPVQLDKLGVEDSKVASRFIELLEIANRSENQDEFHGQFAFSMKLLKESFNVEPENTTMASEVNEAEEDCLKALEDVKTAGKIQNASMVGDAEDKTTETCASQLKTVKIGRQDQGPCAPLEKPQDDRNETEDGEEDIILQFKKTTNKDFVPAMKIVGKLECMERWKKRVTELDWAKEKIEDIHGTDMFLIAREAIVSPNTTRDFCLAFGLHEQKLVKGFSKDQKLVYLILKTLRKGCFDHTFKQNSMPLKLRTYHMKTVALWTFENGYLSNARDVSEHESILQATRKAVAFLAKAVNSNMLKHYFTEDNLFGNFDDADFEIILKVCVEIQSATKEEIEKSLERSEITTDQIRLSRDQIGLLLQLEDDGGREDNVNRIREGLADAIRGATSAKKDRQGDQSALKLAILDGARLLFHEPQESRQAFRRQFKDVQTNIENYRDIIDLCPNFEYAKYLSEINTNTQIKQEMAKIDGTESMQSVLRWAAAVNYDNLAEDIDGIIKQIGQFLTGPDDLKDAVLKVKLALIFL